MSYFLLTGATGLLGRYLLRDLTLADVPLAVVVRESRWETPQQRIETVMTLWEQELGRALVRPVVLAGDISQACLGLDPADLQWLGDHCEHLIHSAASLTFHADEAEGEPWRSNVGGTQHALELCQRVGIRQFHHVSTAYVCGQRRGRVLETELDVGQQPGNDYEESKIAAEKAVLSSDFLQQTTIYRPSIIVGDSETGLTTSYHGFYTPLRLIHAISKSASWDEILQGDWLGGLQLKGDESKNLVPVNWVSAAMTALITAPETHGQTYHLTNPHPPTVAEMVLSIAEAIGELAMNQPAVAKGQLPREEMVNSFRENMKIYESYWSDDPEFDRSHLDAVLPDLPCPRITHREMRRLIDYAIEKNFGWPREATVTPEFEVRRYFRRQLDQSNASGNGHTRYVNLRVSGSGGGQWHLILNRSELVAARPGLRGDDGPTCHLTSATFAQLVQGTLSWDQAINTGKLVVAGSSVHPREIARLFHDFSIDETTVRTLD